MAAWWGVLPKGTGMHELRGQTGTPLKARDSPSSAAGTEEGGWAADGPGGLVLPSSHAITESAHRDLPWRARVPPWCKWDHFQSLVPALPWLLTRIHLRHPTFHVSAWLFCSGRAKLSVPRVCGEYPLPKSPANSVTSFNNNKLWGETGGCSAFIFI